MLKAETKTAVQCGRAITLRYGSLVLGIFGVTRLWDGVYEIWGLTSDVPKEVAKTLAKRMKAEFTKFCIDSRARRVQVVVRCNFYAELKFAKFLGFQQEGIMRRYGPEGDNYYLLGRVF